VKHNFSPASFVFVSGILIAGANPTIMSYNTSAVKIYNAKKSLVRFESRNFFLYFE
jgi:hypothetical protein